MKRLSTGDYFVFEPDGTKYTVVSVSKTEYHLKCVYKNDNITDSISYNFSTIHNLFGGDGSWTLTRIKVNHLPEELFKV